MNGNLDNLAFRFFKLFAKYEYTMKKHGLFRVLSGRIVVDWDRFANKVVGPNFRNDLGDNASASDYILQNPPMKQAVNPDGIIIWEEVSSNDQSVQTLFAHIRRIRNNLFHGAKFSETWFNPDRSKKLLEKGLVILEHYRTRDFRDVH